MGAMTNICGCIRGVASVAGVYRVGHWIIKMVGVHVRFAYINWVFSSLTRQRSIVVRASTRGAGGWGSIPDRVTPKT